MRTLLLTALATIVCALAVPVVAVPTASAQMTTADRLFNRTQSEVADRMFYIAQVYFPPPAGQYRVSYAWVRNCRNIATGLARCDWTGLIRNGRTPGEGAILYREDGLSEYRNGVFTLDVSTRG